MSKTSIVVILKNKIGAKKGKKSTVFTKIDI